MRLILIYNSIFFSNGAALIKEKMKANGREDEEEGRFVISAPRELAGFMN